MLEDALPHCCICLIWNFASKMSVTIRRQKNAPTNGKPCLQCKQTVVSATKQELSKIDIQLMPQQCVSAVAPANCVQQLFGMTPQS